MSQIMNLIRNEEGATALEYGLLAALIAAAIATAVGVLGGVVSSTFDSIATTMQGATSSGT